MSYYRTCPDCGAHNDPGETCECKRGQLAIVSQKPRMTDGAKYKADMSNAIRELVEYCWQNAELARELTMILFRAAAIPYNYQHAHPEVKPGPAPVVPVKIEAPALPVPSLPSTAPLTGQAAPVTDANTQALIQSLLARIGALEARQQPVAVVLPVPALPANPATRMRITTPLLSKKLLTIPELCAYMSIGRNTALDLLHSEGFPMVRIGVRLLADRVKLDQWIAERTGAGVRL